jgi:hypothetical protein
VYSFKHSRAGVLLAAALTILFGAISVLAQTPAGGAPVDTFSGKYEGTAKNPDGSFMNLLLELKNEAGKVSGSATSGATTLKISEGSLADAKLTVKFEGREGVLNAKVEADKITGEWIEGSRKLAVEFKKVVPSATAPATTAAPATAFSLPGEWEAVADANGQPFPFLLVLKLDGEKVTGTSSSQLGDSNISSGSWKDGRLAFALEGPNGTVTMSATVVEGKLTGEFDFAGQLQGRWVAVKKK